VIEDIDRIEVTRGPDSASYGSNSMMGIVNIITKHPADIGRATWMAGAGTGRAREALARIGGNIGPSTAYRLTVDRQQNSGIARAAGLPSGHDGAFLNRVNFRSVSEIGDQDTVDVQFGLVQGVRKTAYVDRYQKTYPDIDLLDSDLSVLWKRNLSEQHAFQVLAYTTTTRNDQPWTTCVPTATLLPQMFDLWKSNPSYVNALLAGRKPSGGTPADDALALQVLAAAKALGPRMTAPTCVDANQNLVERRHDIELQDTLVLSDRLRLVSGLGVREDVGDSVTFLGGRVSNTVWRAFANAEYRPVPWLNLNGGGFIEKDQLTGSAFSPRLAGNFHVAEHHTLRAVLTRGVRMPDIHEQRATTSYTASNFTPALNGVTEGMFYQSAKAPGNLHGERNFSRELGYLGNYPGLGLLVDARVFDDRLTQLVSEKLQLSDFRPTNANSVRLRGAELQLTYHPDRHWQGNLSYGYLRSSDATTVLEQTQFSRQTGSVGLSYADDHGWRYTLAGYGAGPGTDYQEFYGREDLMVSKDMALGGDRKLHLAFTLRHLNNTYVRTFQDYGKNLIQDRASPLQFTVKIALNY